MRLFWLFWFSLYQKIDCSLSNILNLAFGQMFIVAHTEQREKKGKFALDNNKNGITNGSTEIYT